MTQAAAISQLSDIRSFILAGNAKFTLVSKKTGARKTFKVESNADTIHDKPGFFVSLLVGPDNSDRGDFHYLGFMFPARRQGLEVYLFKQNRQRYGLEAVAAFVWLLGHLNNPTLSDAGFSEQAEFWHAGECARCGRELTDPESIARGLGPVCAERS